MDIDHDCNYILCIINNSKYRIMYYIRILKVSIISNA